MTHFLIRSATDPKGYVVIDRKDGDLPRTANESYVPYALTHHEDQVVYARHGEHHGYRKNPRWRLYDTQVSQDRRRLTETDLGMYALSMPELTSAALFQVSRGVRAYLVWLYVYKKKDMLEVIYNDIGSYFFTGGRKGFGRLGEQDHKTLTPEYVRQAIVDKLATGTVDQKLSIYDAIGRKIVPVFGGAPEAVYNQWKPIVRQDWFEDPNQRGRNNAAGKVAPTKQGGLVAQAKASLGVGTHQDRNRGVDMFARDLGRQSHPEANAYYDGVDDRNLLFGAGISGTTGTLLQAGFAFAEGLSGELLKQYVLAIVGYLVGGGMHSYHESMVIARKAGVPYVTGAFLTSLPQSFLSTRECRDWTERYYDVVKLGATHWRHAAPHLPSHLNIKLGTTPVRPMPVERPVKRR